ncbi:MAG: hypothetical protein ACMXYG_04480 [Candidatus Woesearchaeota archaeon]
MFNPDEIKSDFGKNLFRQNFGIYYSKPVSNTSLLESNTVDESADESADEPKIDSSIPHSFNPDVLIIDSNPHKIEQPEVIQSEIDIVDDKIRSDINSRSLGPDSELEDLLHESRSGFLSSDVTIKSADDKSRNISLELSPYSITAYMRNNKVVGEEANASLITVALANKKHIILEGESGTGKSYVMKTILGLFDGVYELGLASGQAIWYQTEQINDSKIIYLPELQKVVADKSNKVNGIIEFMKNLGEGKDAVKVTTNNKRDGVDTYTISSGRTMVSTIAKENSFNYDRELQRRFLILETDNSPEHIQQILDDKIQRKVNIDVSNGKKDLEHALIERVNYVMSVASDFNVINPFLDYMKSFFPITSKVQSYIDHYFDLFDSFGKFFSPSREIINIDGNNFVILNLEDVVNVYNMYHSSFIKTLESFNDDDSLDKFLVDKPNWTECYKVGLDCLRKLTISYDNEIVNLVEAYPDSIDSWINNQVLDGKIYVTDYISGESIVVADLELKDDNYTNHLVFMNPSPESQALYEKNDKTDILYPEIMTPDMIVPEVMDIGDNENVSLGNVSLINNYALSPLIVPIYHLSSYREKLSRLDSLHHLRFMHQPKLLTSGGLE